MNLRKFALACVMCLVAALVQAKTGPYPNKPIKLVVGFAPGGAADDVARAVGAPAIQSVVAGDTQLTFGTPPAVVKRLFEATQHALQQPGVKAALAREGTEVALSASPESFALFLAEDAKFWVKLVKDADVKSE